MGTEPVETRLLVTTYRKALVTGGGDVVLDEGRGPYFGATWGPDRLYVAARNWGRRGEGTLLLAYDQGLKLVEEHCLPDVREVHQMLWWDGLVYVCDTGHDRVVAWDGAKLTPMYAATDSMEDRCHVNSVWCDGERFWVTELYARRVRSFDMDWRLLETIPVEHEVHDVYVGGDVVWTCASDRGCLVRLGAGEPLYVDVSCGEFAYARGLARAGGRFYVGLSSVRERESRGSGGCRVAVLDDGLAKVGEIAFKGTGDMHSLRAMDGIDRAHNRLRCPA